MKTSVAAFVGCAAVLTLAGCSTPSASPSQAFVPAVEVSPPDRNAEAMAERRETKRKAEETAREVRNLGVDDYVAGSDMVQRVGEKSQRQLEKEKIHRLAKLCIEANNTSPPCQDIVNVNARMGKFYILQESQEISAALKRMSR